METTTKTNTRNIEVTDREFLDIGTANLTAFIAAQDAGYDHEMIDVVRKHNADLDTVYALQGFVREGPDSDLFINLRYTDQRKRDLSFLRGNRPAVAALATWKTITYELEKTCLSTSTC